MLNRIISFLLITTVISFTPTNFLLRPKPSTKGMMGARISMELQAKKKKVVVLGGDGFCGWPTSLYLSDQGHGKYARLDGGESDSYKQHLV